MFHFNVLMDSNCRWKSTAPTRRHPVRLTRELYVTGSKIEGQSLPGTCPLPHGSALHDQAYILVSRKYQAACLEVSRLMSLGCRNAMSYSFAKLSAAPRHSSGANLVIGMLEEDGPPCMTMGKP